MLGSHRTLRAFWMFSTLTQDFTLALLKLAGEELFPYVMRSERMDLRVYRALFNALEARLPRIRLAVSLRQRAFGDGPMRVWNLLSPSPARYIQKADFLGCH